MEGRILQQIPRARKSPEAPRGICHIIAVPRALEALPVSHLQREHIDIRDRPVVQIPQYTRRLDVVVPRRIPRAVLPRPAPILGERGQPALIAAVPAPSVRKDEFFALQFDDPWEVHDLVLRLDEDIDAFQLNAQCSGFALVRRFFEHDAPPGDLTPCPPSLRGKGELAVYVGG